MIREFFVGVAFTILASQTSFADVINLTDNGSVTIGSTVITCNATPQIPVPYCYLGPPYYAGLGAYQCDIHLARVVDGVVHAETLGNCGADSESCNSACTTLMRAYPECH